MSKKLAAENLVAENETLVEDTTNTSEEISNETVQESTPVAPTPKAAVKTVITNVEMEDGKVVAFPGKRKLQIEAKVDDKGTLNVRCDFINGRVLQTAISGEMLIKFLEFGAGQKFRDLIAGEEDLDSAVLDVEEFITLLGQGKWANDRVRGSGSSAPLHKAVMQVTGKTAEEVKVWLGTLNQTQKLALRNDPQIKPIIAALEAAKKSKQPAVDTGALLAGLMG